MSGMADSSKEDAVMVSYLSPPPYCLIKLSLMCSSGHFTSYSSYLNNSLGHVLEKNMIASKSVREQRVRIFLLCIQVIDHTIVQVLLFLLRSGCITLIRTEM
jgi:hypothetical protein